MICPRCGCRIREGELICSACNILLSHDRTVVLDMTHAPGYTTTGLLIKTETGEIQLIRLEIAGSDFEFRVHEGSTIVIGRSTESDGYTVEDVLDLMSLGGDECGVSRRHAMIRIDKKSAYMVDLDSTNGTFLNGYRMRPKFQHPLYDGDIIRFGALEARIELM